MKTKLNNVNKGFTIIEVMIVLAIAGLIMAIVFFAVPQLRRNSADNQRQSVANRVKAEMDTYSANNQGVAPIKYVNNTQALTPSFQPCPTVGGAGNGSCGDFATRYLANVNINDPTTNAAMPISIASCPAAVGATCGFTYNKGNLYIVAKATCTGDTPYGAAGSNQFALVVGLDRTNTRYCVDNG
jgi:prepilin-type N-terminal cleavage/methylation domain-containing protein